MVSPYTFSLALGAVGMTVMAAMGLGSHAHGGHAHGQGHGQATGHGNGHAHGHAHTRAVAHGQPALFRVAAILSPRLWFTLLTGFGAAGLLVRPLVAAEPVRAALAVVGAVAFEWLLARPLWNFGFRFASRPATTLESSITDTVPAVTGFDREGNGLVAVELDGQIVHVLATLRAADRAAGIHVRAGDRVRVEEVDAARNRCVVSALGS